MYLVCYNIPMNILVLSDTHGELNRALEMYERISTSICKIDRIIHCGDFIKDAHEIEDQTGTPVSCVPGNCDGCNKERFEIIETPAGKIMITHGLHGKCKFLADEPKVSSRSARLFCRMLRTHSRSCKRNFIWYKIYKSRQSH